MKKLSLLLLLLPLLSLAQLKVVDERTGVAIIFTCDEKSFPESWRTAEINAKGVSLDTDEIPRTIKMVKKALAKYPEDVIRKNLKIIYTFKNINFFGQNYGGTNSTYNLYIANSGIANGYTDDYIEKTFHHEFSSMLYRNNPVFFNKKEWLKNCDLPYGKGGVDALKTGKTNQDLDTALCAKGFVHEYGTSDMENDINSIAENIFMYGPAFWEAAIKYPKLNAKVNLLISFYGKINKTFTRTYFEGIKEDKED